ncbi:hypothetical protein ACFLY1_00555 [Patescibacteria group bacterium]
MVNRTNNLMYFIVLSLVLTVIFCFLFIGNFKSYKSEVSVLFVPKSDQASIQSEQIIQNFTELPRRLSFYEKLLMDNLEIKDRFEGFDKDKRKAMWNRSIDIERKEKSSIIYVVAESKNKVQSQKISKQIAITLFANASKYYNVKNDIDLRLIDGPISKTFVKDWYWLALLSILLGIGAAYVISAVPSFLDKLVKQKISSFPHRSYSKKNNNEGFLHFPKKDEIQGKVKKNQAPSNLPVAADEYEFPENNFFISDREAGSAEAELIDNVISSNNDSIKNDNIIGGETDKEPTEEELKERLNQLLKGGL